jgi:hypothetical protein
MLITETVICKNCQKLKDTLIKIKSRNENGTLPLKAIHASQEILIEKIKLQRMVIIFKKNLFF